MTVTLFSEPVPSSTPTHMPTRTVTATKQPATLTPTRSTTNTPTPSPRPPTPSPTPTVPMQGKCVGDCNGDGEVTINEVITGVNIGLGLAPVALCPEADGNGNGEVSIGEVITAVNNGLAACPAARTPTETSLPTATRTPTEGTSNTPTATTTASGTPTPTGAPDPKATIVWTLTDACDDARGIQFRLFQEDGRVFPGASSVYETGVSGTATVAIRCTRNNIVCYGATQDPVPPPPSMPFSWGVGIDKEFPCADCCAKCDDVHISRVLRCG